MFWNNKPVNCIIDNPRFETILNDDLKDKLSIIRPTQEEFIEFINKNNYILTSKEVLDWYDRSLLLFCIYDNKELQNDTNEDYTNEDENNKDYKNHKEIKYENTKKIIGSIAAFEITIKHSLLSTTFVKTWLVKYLCVLDEFRNKNVAGYLIDSITHAVLDYCSWALFGSDIKLSIKSFLEYEVYHFYSISKTNFKSLNFKILTSNSNNKDKKRVQELINKYYNTFDAHEILNIEKYYNDLYNFMYILYDNNNVYIGYKSEYNNKIKKITTVLMSCDYKFFTAVLKYCFSKVDLVSVSYSLSNDYSIKYILDKWYACIIKKRRYYVYSYNQIMPFNSDFIFN